VADHARLGPDPGDVADQHRQGDDGEAPVEPGRQLVDGRCGLRLPGHAEAEDRDIAEPEGEARDEADLGDVDGGEAPAGIDAVAHGAAREHRGADIVADRIAREAAQCCGAIGHVAATDGAQREQVIKGQGEVAERDEQAGQRDVAVADALQRDDDLVGVDAVQHPVQHGHGDDDDYEAEEKSDPIPANPLVEEPIDRTQRLEH
jgi:hypothetical protein